MFLSFPYCQLNSNLSRDSLYRYKECEIFLMWITKSTGNLQRKPDFITVMKNTNFIKLQSKMQIGQPRRMIKPNYLLILLNYQPKICLTKLFTYIVNRKKNVDWDKGIWCLKMSHQLNLYCQCNLKVECLPLLSYSVLRHPFIVFLLVKLAEVTFLLEQLSMMVPAIKTMFMGNIIWWANYTSSMSAPETSLMVRCSINSYLKKNNGQCHY